jgi:hypothetical protein
MIKKYIFAFLIMMIIVSSASALSGSIPISKTNVKSYDTAGSACTMQYSNYMYQFRFASSSYSTISSVVYTPPAGVVYAAETHVDTFYISSGGSGVGFVTVSKGLNHVSWTFSPNTTITSTLFELTYSKNQVYTAISNNAGGYDGAGAAVSASNPIYFKGDTGGGSCNVNTGIYRGSFVVDVGYSTSFSYNVSESSILGAEYYELDVLKPTLLTSKIQVRNDTGALNTETAFNTVHFYDMGVLENNISLNITMADGGNATAQIWPYYIAPVNIPQYVSNPGGSGIATFTTARVWFDTETMYNNSDMHYSYDLKFIMSHSNYTSYFNGLGYEVDVLDPSGHLTSRHVIPISCASTGAWWNPLDNENYSCEATGAKSVIYDAPSGNWTNGTYTAVIFENFLDLREAISEDTINVLKENGYTGIIETADTPFNGDPASVGIDIFASTWFLGILIMVVFAIAGAQAAGIPGFVGGMGIGVVFTFIGGLIPLWALFVFVLIIILCVSIMMAGNVTGGGK